MWVGIFQSTEVLSRTKSRGWVTLCALSCSWLSSLQTELNCTTGFPWFCSVGTATRGTSRPPWSHEPSPKINLLIYITYWSWFSGERWIIHNCFPLSFQWLKRLNKKARSSQTSLRKIFTRKLLDTSLWSITKFGQCYFLNISQIYLVLPLLPSPT